MYLFSLYCFVSKVVSQIQVYLYSAFHDTNRCKAALQEINFYNIFSCSLSVMTIKLMSIWQKCMVKIS